MKGPTPDNPYIYVAIVGISALLCFSLVLTGSFWLTLVVLVLGFLHLARHFPQVEAVIVEDPLLLWLRRVSPLIIIGIFGIVLAGGMLR